MIVAFIKKKLLNWICEDLPLGTDLYETCSIKVQSNSGLNFTSEKNMKLFRELDKYLVHQTCDIIGDAKKTYYLSFTYKVEDGTAARRIIDRYNYLYEFIVCNYSMERSNEY